MRRRRYGDNDKHLGPFTYGKSGHYRPISVVITSGDGDEYPGCELQINVRGFYLVVGLPAIVRPYREKVVAQSWDAATVLRLGRDWYWDTDERRFGFSLSSDGPKSASFLNVWFGRQTDDSSTEKRWSYFLPWTDWRHIRRSLYDCKGKHFYSEMERDRKRGAQWEAMQAVVKACPQAVFEFDDYDGKRIRAATRIEEREWRFGSKWCTWLGVFRKPMIRRSLDIEFSEEVGPEKGSWKGGTLGHGIEMLPGELHEAAFRRYCEQEHRSKSQTYRLAFVGPVAAAA